MKARNKSLDLPSAIAAYWRAANAGDCAGAVAQFDDKAIVHDEGKVHGTRSAIQAWLEETTRKYQPQVEPLRCESEAGRHLIAARVSGRFPGSPAELDFEFTVANEKIVRLEIK